MRMVSAVLGAFVGSAAAGMICLGLTTMVVLVVAAVERFGIGGAVIGAMMAVGALYGAKRGWDEWSGEE